MNLESWNWILNIEILNRYRESHSTDVTSDNNDEESSEEPGPPKRPSLSEIFAALELFQICNFFGGEQDKFSVLEVNFTITETTDKDIYIFHAVISSWGLVISVKYIKLSKNVFFSSFLKSSDLTNLRYIKQNLSVSSEFVKTWVDCILKNYDVIK